MGRRKTQQVQQGRLLRRLAQRRRVRPPWLFNDDEEWLADRRSLDPSPRRNGAWLFTNKTWPSDKSVRSSGFLLWDLAREDFRADLSLVHSACST